MEENDTKQEIKNNNKLHTALSNMYNKQLDALEGKFKKRTYVFGAVGVGVGAFAPKIYILGKWVISILF